MNVDAALGRIEYGGPTEVTLDVLSSLQEAFLLTVPFENLDIHLGREIVLSPDLLEAKIVGQGRGGFCYECNSVFHDLLSALGFDAYMADAQMMMGNDPSPHFDHMVLIVAVGEHEYLVDVGNGGSVRSPMRLGGSDIAAIPEGETYRLSEYRKRTTLDVKEPDADWTHRFVFSPGARALEEFSDRCRYQQTSPDSAFGRSAMATLATPEGRTSMIDQTLKVQVGREVVEERPMSNDAEYRATLADVFGIVLSH